MQLNERLQQLREKAGFENAKAFAKSIGMPYSTYSTYESGKSEPKATALVTIAAALHVSVDDLLGYHVDDFDKAAALFHESTGKTATLDESGVTIAPKVGGGVMWTQPISKESFIQAINDAAARFDRTLRPRLLADAIINSVDRAYLKQHPRAKGGKSDDLAAAFQDRLLQILLEGEQKQGTALEKTAYRAYVRDNVSDILDKWHEEHDADATPPAQDHDNADDEKAKEKGPHSNE